MLSAWNGKITKKYEYDNKLINENEDIVKLFGGFKVWYSPVKMNPKVLIIGINPGVGEFRDDKKISINESSVFEYIQDNSEYRLANEIKKVFNEAGLKQILEVDTMKTNFYHIITKKQYEIKFGLNKIEKGHFDKYDTFSSEIIKELIGILKPTYIFCEGKASYDKVIRLFGECKYSEWKNNYGFSKFNENNITVIGCSRQFSNIKNKHDVSVMLKDLII